MKQFKEILTCCFITIQLIPWTLSQSLQHRRQGLPAAFRVPFGTIQNMKKVHVGNGAVVVDGEVLLTSDLLIQRRTPQGTAYFLFDNPNGNPLYKRREVDIQRKVVVFPDPNFPPGSGHYVVLRHLEVKNLEHHWGDAIYQGLYLVLGDSLHAYMTNWEHPSDPQHKSLRAHDQTSPKGHRTYDVEFTDVDFSEMIKKVQR